MRTALLAAPLLTGAGLTLVLAASGATVLGATAPEATAPAAPARAAGTQAADAPLYECAEGTVVDVEVVGLALCDAEPTAALHERAEPDNLQIREGALVADITEGGSAATEGVQPGDMIYRVAGADVEGAAAAGQHLADVGTESDTQINFLRSGRPYRIKLRR